MMRKNEVYCDHCGKKLNCMTDYDDINIELGHIWRKHDLCAECLEELKNLIDNFCTAHQTEKGGGEE